MQLGCESFEGTANVRQLTAVPFEAPIPSSPISLGDYASGGPMYRQVSLVPNRDQRSFLLNSSPHILPRATSQPQVRKLTSRSSHRAPHRRDQVSTQSLYYYLLYCTILVRVCMISSSASAPRYPVLASSGRLDISLPKFDYLNLVCHIGHRFRVSWTPPALLLSPQKSYCSTLPILPFSHGPIPRCTSQASKLPEVFPDARSSSSSITAPSLLNLHCNLVSSWSSF